MIDSTFDARDCAYRSIEELVLPQGNTIVYCRELLLNGLMLTNQRAANLEATLS